MPEQDSLIQLANILCGKVDLNDAYHIFRRLLIEYGWPEEDIGLEKESREFMEQYNDYVQFLIDQGMQQGIQQGIQQGKEQEKAVISSQLAVKNQQIEEYQKKLAEMEKEIQLFRQQKSAKE